MKRYERDEESGGAEGVVTEELERIGLQMLAVLPRAWVYEVMVWAQTREAFRLYLVMWRDAEDEAERAEVIVSLQALLDDRDRNPLSPGITSKADFDYVYGRRRALKAHLRQLIDERGGVSEVARKAEMPQPSLSRLLNSTAEPRAATMMRLAAAMGVSLSRLYPGGRRPAELREPRAEHLVKPEGS